MQIIVRVPTEQYAYIEAHYESLEEYKKLHPQFAVAVADTRRAAKEALNYSQPPFES